MWSPSSSCQGSQGTDRVVSQLISSNSPFLNPPDCRFRPGVRSLACLNPPGLLTLAHDPWSTGAGKGSGKGAGKGSGKGSGKGAGAAGLASRNAITAQIGQAPRQPIRKPIRGFRNGWAVVGKTAANPFRGGSETGGNSTWDETATRRHSGTDLSNYERDRHP
jgi:hypothetical protein